MNRIKESNSDIHLQLFFFNCAFVILGYGINTITGQAFLTPMKVLRMLILAFSTILLLQHFYRKPRIPKAGIHLFLLYLILLGSFFSASLLFALGRVITFVFPVFYIILFLNYVKSVYSISRLGKIFSSYFQLTYAIPILVFLFFERSFGSTFLKGSVQAFVRNHYGWSSLLFILTSADLLLNYKLPSWRKYATILLLPLSFFILLASGSRSSWLALGITSIVFLLRLKNLASWTKPILVAVFSFPIVFFLGDTNSALYVRWEKTQLQLTKGEEASDRILWANAVVREFNESPFKWFTGRGLFDYDGLANRGYHNSYYEVLFGCGIFVFAYFLYLFLFRPAYFYFRYYSKYFLTFFPLVIIPFFESNLTGGQFLFFPWFTYMMFYSIDPTQRIRSTTRKKRNIPQQGLQLVS